ncbi:amino acid/polyamine/organocation transporter, APC superfamily (TC 2.A.3) [Hymenobacter roseosalivarius DSM 11622]|uniref:Amino acid/polyamine/organocation transporter, APC superfamily (TC 2.A.3) n=1 Tax=Hymenobacter roseosalivarius DSM 11622 TaxID=645990 RepID=A0A1W1VTE0_9BACT|nr:APC family permease [Hymenobacter roseosalivarius]SMB96645.1 amino acid/polyamine/organocation transporter, APC superfamily (TC 2.A.3) [Hymenobacter roseosalivarius DSM 11622]
MSHEKKLNELEATAICGNDISSSCLYVSALAIAYAGQYAWIALLMVGAVLFLFRKIYGEVVGALPLNGGAYNVLLNTTSKRNAALAACLTILSYMATAVISASEAMHYLHTLWHGLPIIWATLGLLGLFLVLTILGISESAKVAVAIFLVHLVSLTLLVGSAIWYLTTHGTDALTANFSLPVKGGSIANALFFGFSAAMLGISGFESSANFVEEQARGVFAKTLRNMWIVVSFFNPAIAFLAVAALPMGEVGEHTETLLSHLGNTTGGAWLGTLISVDAVAVLSGAVLTSFVGVSGLMKRMTLDRILPQFFLKENKRESNYIILITFFLLCVSVLLITNGQLGPLSGVYTISFLAVMAFFALGNFLLKRKRPKLPRPVYAGIFTVTLALVSILLALYGNIKIHPDYLIVFLQYFLTAMVLIYVMLNRIGILNLILAAANSFAEQSPRISRLLRLKLRHMLRELHQQEFVFFTKGDNVSNLNKVMAYVVENEFTTKLKIVTLLRPGETYPQDLLTDIHVLDRAYEQIEVDFVTLEGKFGPELIDKLSREWQIPKNFMFIGSPGDQFPYHISELGGVRLII